MRSHSKLLSLVVLLGVVLIAVLVVAPEALACHKASHRCLTQQVPAAPTNLTASAVSSSQIDLTWTDNASNESGYTVERSSDGTTFTTITSSLAADTTSYSDTALSASTRYYYRVKAANSVGSSSYSNTADATTQAGSASSGSAVLVGAGDISSCTNNNDEATAKLLDSTAGTVFTAGDNAYDSGTLSEFNNCYNPTWGRHKARTAPSVGNHEYLTAGASGYFDYFGTAAGDPSKGYYSYDLGDWHVVALNSMCENVGGCDATSPMVTWLQNDLAANPKPCTLAYFHHPLYSSGTHGNNPKMQPAWDALYAANADVVVNGHDHLYERFAPQSPAGVADDTRGIREFVVGTGGKELYSWGTVQANSQVRNNATYGVLKLTLNPTSYDWQFLPVAGSSFTDSGSTSCH